MSDIVINLTAAEAAQLSSELLSCQYTARLMIQDGVVKVSLDFATWSRGVGQVQPR